MQDVANIEQVIAEFQEIARRLAGLRSSIGILDNLEPLSDYSDVMREWPALLQQVIRNTSDIRARLLSLPRRADAEPFGAALSYEAVLVIAERAIAVAGVHGAAECSTWVPHQWCDVARALPAKLVDDIRLTELRIARELSELEATLEQRPAEDDSAYVLASRLNIEGRFPSLKAACKWLDSPEAVKIRQRRPNPRRREVHAGDFYQHWAQQDRERDSLLDEEGLQEYFADIEARKTEAHHTKKLSRPKR